MEERMMTMNRTKNTTSTSRTRKGGGGRRRERRSIARRRAEKGIDVHAPSRGERQRTSLGAPTLSQITRIKTLRAEGKSYSAIERALGWPDRHGGRVWYILNVPRAYGEREIPLGHSTSGRPGLSRRKQ